MYKIHPEPDELEILEIWIFFREILKTTEISL
jgi:hypothetical protein